MHLLNNRLGRITALIALGGAALYSQGTQTANITGTVVDAAGAPIAGVVVRLTSPALQGVRTYTTDATGKFIARLLPPGFYTIQYTKDGLETRKVTESLGIDQTFSPKVTLTKVGGAVVEVIAAAPAVDKTDVKTASNYRADSVDLLPNARNMEGVALLTPGVTAGVGGRVQIRGAMTSGNLYLLDGQNIADNAYNNRGLAVIDDSIEETQIITGAMSAEYGDVDGGVINSITRSGSNEFAGSLRWELQNPDWNATAPLQARGASINNLLSEFKTLSVSGPILKDKLWFSTSYYTTKSSAIGSIGGNLSADPLGLGAANPTVAGTGYGSSYTAGTNEIRRQIKLTWSINQDHTLVGAFMRNETNQTNRNYSAGEIASLVPQKSTSNFYNIALRSAWTSNLTTEVRFGRKNQMLSAGGLANGQSPIQSDDTGLYYNNGIFNSTDGGDNRGNKTYNVKASLFWNLLGSHQTDFGIDYYDGIRRAKNEQTPTGFIFEAAGMNLITRTAIPTAIWTYQSAAGEAQSFSTGLYVNDKWSLDQHWNFQIGLRWDKYKAQNEAGAQTAGANGLSPRLGVKFDLFGDSKHIFGASYAKYNAKVLEGITNSVTLQGNPKEIDYYAFTYATGGGTPATSYDWLNANRTTFANLQNPALYDFTNIAYYNDPTLNVKLNRNMKAPTVEELQASYAYSFNFGGYGDGYVKVTGVSKKWNNLMDVSTGNNGTVLDGAGNTLYVKLWDNNPDAKREYKGLEVESQYNRNQWSYTTGITWSSLKGNYEGEGTNTPGRGESIHYYDVVGGVSLYDSSKTAPYGYLTGHVPIRIRATGNRVFNNGFGKTSVGLVYRFDSGAHYSNTRTMTAAQLNPALPGQFGATSTQYLNDFRGGGVYNSASYLDLAVTHDFPLFKAMGKDVTAFAKFNIGNVLNHQQIVTFNTSWNRVPNTAPYAYPNAYTAPWVQSPATTTYTGFGNPQSFGNYGTPRTVAVSAGFRF
ncbi:MAG: TonB-dependent receptor [Geothrix sp.]|uniref:TonB-dependent receptor n=1 Tax=Geothrix sp. TaxID=1962974 RepID=UPI0017F9520D|nr:TonB-dependent receptor [Geothrix sp.]NWJ40978.1 TonB-dependent receptor [Geothrix sp.]WIL21025.1 MAG: TonB-dependent receptor [Geothrix sp.]